jgi:hypothetical protein
MCLCPVSTFPFVGIGRGRKRGLEEGALPPWCHPNEMERENKIANGMITTSEKNAKRIYPAVTTPFVVTMMLGGVMLLADVASNVEGITHLGYPIYICKILVSPRNWPASRSCMGAPSDPKRMGLCWIYVQPTQSVSFACTLWRPFYKDHGANHHSCFRPGFLSAMEEFFECSGKQNTKRLQVG